MNEGATAIERLAAFASSSFAEIPDPVRAAGTNAIVNAVSLAVEAAHHDAVEAVLSLVATFAHGDAARVLGRADGLIRCGRPSPAGPPCTSKISTIPTCAR